MTNKLIIFKVNIIGVSGLVDMSLPAAATLDIVRTGNKTGPSKLLEWYIVRNKFSSSQLP